MYWILSALSYLICHLITVSFLYVNSNKSQKIGQGDSCFLGIVCLLNPPEFQLNSRQLHRIFALRKKARGLETLNFYPLSKYLSQGLSYLVCVKLNDDIIIHTFFKADHKQSIRRPIRRHSSLPRQQPHSPQT